MKNKLKEKGDSFSIFLIGLIIGSLKTEIESILKDAIYVWIFLVIIFSLFFIFEKQINKVLKRNLQFNYKRK